MTKNTNANIAGSQRKRNTNQPRPNVAAQQNQNSNNSTTTNANKKATKQNQNQSQSQNQNQAQASTVQKPTQTTPKPKSPPLAREEPHVPLDGFNAEDVDKLLQAGFDAAAEHYQPERGAAQKTGPWAQKRRSLYLLPSTVSTH